MVVGTPGRVKDFIQRSVLDPSCLLFRVLDEADEMLALGFVEDVEFILNAGAHHPITRIIMSPNVSFPNFHLLNFSF